MTTQEAILEKNYKNYKKRITYSQNVIKAMEEYGKYCAEIAFDDGFGLGFIDNQRPSFDEWWLNFQKNEETK